MKFNIKDGWKKVAEDAKSTTLKHPSGHTMQIAHGAIHPKMKEALASLPLQTSDKEKKESVKDPKHSSPKEKPIKMAQGGEAPEGFAPAQEDANSGAASQPTDTPAKDAPSGDSPPQPPINININSGPNPQSAPQPSDAPPQQLPQGFVQSPGGPLFDPRQYALQNPNAPISAKTEALEHQNQVKDQDAQAATASIQQQKSDIDAYNAQAQKAGLPPKPYPPELQAQLASAPQPGTAPGATPGGLSQLPGEQPGGIGADPYGTEAYYNSLSKGIGEQKGGLQAEAAAQSALGEKQAGVLQDQVHQEQDRAKSYQDHYSELDNERKSFTQDIQNQHIDPSHYWSNLSTLGKISTTLGLILGGFGGGITGGGNPALQKLNMEIDRDISAQKDNLNKSENLLSANLKQFGNLRDATDMTRVMQSEVVKNQLAMEASKAQGPLAKARAQQAIGQIDQQNAQALSNIAMRRTLLGGVNAGKIPPEQVIRLIVPEGEKNDAYKELQTAQNLIRGRDNALSAFDQLMKINTLGNHALNPIQASRQAAALTGPITAQLSKETAGRFTEQDAKYLESQWPATGDSSKTVAIKRAAINKLLNEKMNFPKLQAYGINVAGLGRFAPSGQNKISESAPVVK